MRRKILIGLLAFFLVGTLSFLFWFPRYIEGRIERSLVARGDALGFTTEVEGVDVSWSGSVDVEGLQLKGAEHLGVDITIPELAVTTGNVALFERRVSLSEVYLDKVLVDIVDLDRLKEWWSARQRKSEGSGVGGVSIPTSFAGFTLDRKPMPTFVLSDVSVKTPVAVFSGCHGQVHDKALTLDMSHLILKMECSFLHSGRMGRVTIKGTRDPSEPGWDATIVISPPIELPVGDERIRIAGIHRKPDGSIEAVGLEFVAAGMIGEVATVMVQLKPGVDGFSLINRARNSKNLREAIIPSLASITMDQVVLRGKGDGNLAGRIRGTLEGLLPSVLRSFPEAVSEDDEATKKTSLRRGRRETSIHRTVLSAFDGLDSKFKTLLTVPARLHKMMPLECVRIKRARIVDRPNDVAVQDVLHHVDAELCREGTILVLNVSFRTPATGEDRNKISLRVESTEPALMGEAKLQRLPLEPYSAFLPSWLEGSKDASIRGVHILLAAHGADRSARLEGGLGLKNVRLFAPAVSEQPIVLDQLRLEGIMDYDANVGALSITEGKVDLGEQPVEWSLAIGNVPTNPRVDLRAHLNPVDANRMFRSVPSALVSTIRDATFSGQVSADFELGFHTRNLNRLKLRFEPEAPDFKILNLGSKVRLKTLNNPFIHRFSAGKKQVEIVVGPDNPYFVPYHEIPEHLILAITTTEDGRFFKHQGFAKHAIRRSLVRNLKKGAFVRGASTISQQTVKNLFLSHEKTIARKVQEAIITTAVEDEISKERLLEIYFNVIEWGPDLYGLGSASRFYFDKVPQDLRLEEVLFLVSLIPSPRRYVKEFERGRVSPSWRKRLARYARKMVSRGKISQEEFRKAQPFDPVFRGQKRDIIETLPPPRPINP
jgi:hypothetical protein